MYLPKRVVDHLDVVKHEYGIKRNKDAFGEMVNLSQVGLEWDRIRKGNLGKSLFLPLSKRRN